MITVRQKESQWLASIRILMIIRDISIETTYMTNSFLGYLIIYWDPLAKISSILHDHIQCSWILVRSWSYRIYTLQGPNPALIHYRLQHQHRAPLASHFSSAINTRTQNAPRLSHLLSLKYPPHNHQKIPWFWTACYCSKSLSPSEMCIYHRDLTPRSSRKITLFSHVLRKRQTEALVRCLEDFELSAWEVRTLTANTDVDFACLMSVST